MGKLTVELVYQTPHEPIPLCHTSDPDLLRLVASSMLEEWESLAQESRDVDRVLSAIYEGEASKLQRVLKTLMPNADGAFAPA